MRSIGLTVNEEKTCIRRLPDETVDFLGYLRRREARPQTQEAWQLLHV